MATKRPPHVTEETPIGQDVDLERSVVRDTSGRRVTKSSVDRLVKEAERRPGRPSLTKSGVSPTVAFRVPQEMRDRAERLAKREGKTVSELAREALEARLRAG